MVVQPPRLHDLDKLQCLQPRGPSDQQLPTCHSPQAWSHPVLSSSLLQSWVLQLWVSVSGPEQPAPPQDGAGLVQVRVRVCVPPPQEAEQPLQPLQPLQPPSTLQQPQSAAHVEQFSPYWGWQPPWPQQAPQSEGHVEHFSEALHSASPQLTGQFAGALARQVASVQ